jgi:hypothetical protein
MQAPPAPPFTRCSTDAVSSEIRINGLDSSIEKPIVDPDEAFSLNLSATLNTEKIFETCAQNPSAQLDFVLELRSDNLKLRYVLHTERIHFESDGLLSYEGQLPGQIYHAGAEIRACICVTLPSPMNDFSCNTAGGIVWESRIPLSRRSNAPALPIEFVDSSSSSNQTWMIEFNGTKSDDLAKSATGAIRVFITNSTPLADSLRSNSTESAFKLASRLIAIEVSIEAVLYVISDDELLESIEDCWETQPNWLKEEGSIGYFLAARCLKAAGAQSLESLRDQFKENPNLVRQNLRGVFIQW